MKCFGLIGYPLSHSFSAGYFAKKFKAENLGDYFYDLYPLQQIEDLPELIHEKTCLLGLNVTIPYKEKAIAYLNSVDPVGQAVGAVNTIKIIRNGSEIVLKGYNTDVFGFRKSVEPFIHKYLQRALILGSGGAAKAVSYVFNQMGISTLTVSRNPVKEGQIAYPALNRTIIESIGIIVNTSPLGMYPHIRDCPDIPYEYLTKRHLLYDLIYNPEITEFLRRGNQQQAFTMNGLQMLHLQAEESWSIWNSDEY